MNHEFDYDNADRKDLLERCKSFEVAMNAQHALIMSTFKERDQLRELCGELLDEVKEFYSRASGRSNGVEMLITKAESILGEKNGR